MSDNAPTMDIYCISYNRADETIVHKLLEYVTFVVRKSQEAEYRKLGAEVLAVEDDLVCSFAHVNNWIIEHAPADVVAVLDDDISKFTYCIEKVVKIETPEEATREIERMCQVAYDLDIALLGTPILPIPYKYTEPYKFSGMIGPMRIYNRKLIKARYKYLKFFSDTDFVLQELLQNRIVLRPDYFCPAAKLEKNKGGMNITRNKKTQDETAALMKQWWGKYFNFNDSGMLSNVTIISVKR